MKVLFRAAFVLALLVFVPSLVQAQASIAGVVKDSSGAVLPGVTVEAASPALIEKLRSAVTDANGQYRIEDLRPGTYVVTFKLSGFSVIERPGIELTGSFAAKVDADLRVGTLAETITVSGETPVVDVVNARKQSTIPNDAIAATRSDHDGRPVAPVPTAWIDLAMTLQHGWRRMPDSPADRTSA